MRILSMLWRLPRQVLVALVHAYRLLLSPWVGASCRFAPTCSVYAIQALERHGAVAGSALTAWRILRCNPWCAGGCDPVPDNGAWRHSRAGAASHSAAGLFTGLLPREPGAAPAAATSAAAAGAETNLSKTPS